MIRKMDMEFLDGLMEESILEIGKMVNNMEEDNSIFKMDKKKLDSGLKAKKLNGFKINLIQKIKKCRLNNNWKKYN